LLINETVKMFRTIRIQKEAFLMEAYRVPIAGDAGRAEVDKESTEKGRRLAALPGGCFYHHDV
jgi:hypothetical protein